MCRSIFISLTALCLLACSQSADFSEVRINCVTNEFLTQKVILVVIDGPRLSETWEHPEQKYIPFQANHLRRKGVVAREFYNLGNTYTIPGHIALTTGSYDFKTNDGTEYPNAPSLFQLFLKCTQFPPEEASIITSKGKLDVLGNCEDLSLRNSFRPSMYSKDRTDKQTFKSALRILDEEQPSLSLIHLKGPDTYGHRADWENYLKSIVETDSLLNEIIEFTDRHPAFAGVTTVMMTNDHGRHLDGIADGFVSHGDHCRGCTHINFMAFGPDFIEDTLIYTKYELIDILPTTGALLGFDYEGAQGVVMSDLFKN